MRKPITGTTPAKCTERSGAISMPDNCSVECRTMKAPNKKMPDYCQAFLYIDVLVNVG
ncbi:hypothetical protein [Polluticaenibacter yanchengensis]|uniref:hypothetical protein n=1 Tax=Polluticaenibacter yanchengensis TaxID=3014562 RepID=UPI00387B9796